MTPPDLPSAAAGPITPEQARWLHDKYERLAAEEGSLSASRTSYYAGIGTVLITGLLVALADLMAERTLLMVVVTFLSGLGIMISLVWAVLLHRTNDAQRLWRDSARWVEERYPPIVPTLSTTVPLRPGGQLPIDVARPYESHAARFSHNRSISWMDRLDPTTLMEILPLTFLLIWGVVLVSVWVWFLAIA